MCYFCSLINVRVWISVCFLLYKCYMVLRVLEIVISVHTENNRTVALWVEKSISYVLLLVITYLCVSKRSNLISFILECCL